MLVEYSRANVLTLPIVKDGMIERNLLLSPGINDIPKKDWDQVSKLPKVNRLTKANDIVVVQDEDPKDDGHALAKKDIKEVAPIIAKTFNIVLLENWLSCETRPSVVSAINNQLKVIEEKTTPTKEEN